MKKPIHLIVGLFAVLAAPVALAATTWGFTSTGGTEGGVINGYGNNRQWTVDGISATATAWANTVGTSNTQLEQGYVGWYSGGGLGVQNKDCVGSTCKAGANYNGGDLSENANPEHSVDSETRFDSILFTFSQAVSLSQLSIGWKSGDADIFVMAYTGSPTATVNTSAADVNSILNGKTYSNLASSGWRLTGNVSNLATGTLAAANNVLTATSMYWLVGVANSGVMSGVDTVYDYFKIASLKGDKYNPPPPPSVPEPGSAALLGLAMLGLMRYRKRA